MADTPTPLTLGPIVKLRHIRRPVSQISPTWVPENGRPIYGTDDTGLVIISEKVGDGVTQYQNLQELFTSTDQNYKKWVTNVDVNAFNLYSTSIPSLGVPSLYLAKNTLAPSANTLSPSLTNFVSFGSDNPDSSNITSYLNWLNSSANFTPATGNYITIQTVVDFLPSGSGMKTFPLFSKAVNTLGDDYCRFTLNEDQNSSPTMFIYEFFLSSIPTTGLGTWYEVPPLTKDIDTITGNGNYQYKIHIDACRNSNNTFIEFRLRIELLVNTGNIGHNANIICEFKDSNQIAFFSARVKPSNYWAIKNSGTDPNTVLPQWNGTDPATITVINNVTFGVGSNVPYSLKTRGNTAIFNNTTTTDIADFQVNGVKSSSFDSNGNLIINALATATSSLTLSSTNAAYKTVLNNNVDATNAFEIKNGGQTLFKSTSMGYTGITIGNASSSRLNLFGNIVLAGGSTSMAGLGNALSVGTTVTASANSDTLIGADINTVFNNGSPILTYDTLTGGSGYTDGTYTNVTLILVTGTKIVNATGTVVVSGGVVTGLTITYGGSSNTVGDILTATSGSIGTGTGFTFRVATVGVYTGINQYQLRVRSGTSIFAPSTASYGSIIIPQGVTYTGTTSGAMWQDGTHLYAYINGAARQLDQQSTGGGGSITAVSGTLGRIFTSGTTSITVDIDANYLGQATITTLGTITTGTWTGIAITDAYISSASTWNAKMSNPMTNVGDLIVGGTVSGGLAAPARLGIGPANWLPSVNLAGTGIEYRDLALSGGLGGGFSTGLINLYLQDDIINQGDTNITVVNTGNFYELGTTLTANRTISITSAGASTGQRVIFWNRNINGFTWTFTGSGTIIDVNGNSVVTLNRNTLYLLESDGSNWIVTNSTNISNILGMGTGISTFLTTPTSANLASAITDETGTGSLVFANGATLINPLVGTQTAGDNSNKAASTAYVDQGNQYFVLGTFVGSVDPATPTPGSVGNKFTLGIYASNNTFSGINTINQANLGTGTGDALIVGTSTASLSSGATVQNSGNLRIRGTAYGSTLGISQNVDTYWNIQPTTGTVPNGSLALYSQINGGTASILMTIPLGGGMFIYNTIFQNLNFISGTSTDGLVLNNSAAASSSTTLQKSTRIRYVGSLWNLSGTPATNYFGFTTEASGASGAAPTAEYDWSTYFGTSSTPTFTKRMSLDAATGNLSLLTGSLKIASPQTSVGGSTSGTALFSQPQQGTSMKMVMINLTLLLGTASYTFPTPFVNTPVVLTTNGLASSIVTTLNTTTVTVTGATTSGVLILMGD